jgi:hypothetical protein
VVSGKVGKVAGKPAGDALGGPVVTGQAAFHIGFEAGMGQTFPGAAAAGAVCDSLLSPRALPRQRRIVSRCRPPGLAPGGASPDTSSPPPGAHSRPKLKIAKIPPPWNILPPSYNPGPFVSSRLPLLLRLFFRFLFIQR